MPSIVHDVLRAPGRPLDAATRALMEPRFGHDFSAVRVHTDAQAAASAAAVDALAYTVGRDVVFGAGQYAPGTHAGQRVLAHELTHVAQQSGSAQPASARLTLGPVSDGFEAEADRAAAGILSPAAGLPAVRSTAISARRLQRQFVTPLAAGGGFRGLMERDRRATMDATSSGGEAATETSAEAGPDIFMCSKALDTSPIGSHAFFRIGGSGKGNPTISLQPIDASLGANCWQGVPDRDYPSDFNAEGDCELTTISQSCLEREFSAYPIGHYCTLGPNSNTFVGHVARRCGISNPDPSGWTPGIDDSPPPSGTFAPDKWETLRGCTTKICIMGRESPEDPIG